LSPRGRQRRTGGARPNSGRWEGLCIPTDIHLYLHSSPSSPTRAHGPLLPPPPRSWGRVSIGRRRRRGDPHGEDEEEGTPMATCTTRPRVWTVCFHSIMHSQAQAPPPRVAPSPMSHAPNRPLPVHGPCSITLWTAPLADTLPTHGLQLHKGSRLGGFSNPPKLEQGWGVARGRPRAMGKEGATPPRALLA